MLNVTEEVRHLHKLARRDPGKRFDHLWETLCDPRWLAQAWEQIRGNRGSQTAGIDQMTAVDVDMPKIIKWAEELKTGRYQPTPVRRVHIPKPNGKTRPLGIPTIKDRVVQQGLKMVLEPIFEADFHPCSHGFRQGHSTHIALRDVARSYPAINWIIEGDIKGCFDNIPHAKLMRVLSGRIADGKILSLIRRFLKAGYMEDWQLHRTYSGTPQGGVLSPLLANIFLNQLDEFVINELGGNQTQSWKEHDARRNPQWLKVTDRLKYLRKKFRRAEATDQRELINKIRQLEKQRKHLPHYDKDKRHPCRVKYVRYADDFVVMTVGTKAEAEAVKDKVSQRLTEMGLSLNEEKTKLTHWRRWIHFLGYDIRGKLEDRGVTIRPVLKIPHEKVRDISKEIGRICSYRHIPEADAMVQINAMYRGWCNYYRYANSPQVVFGKLSAKVWWLYAHYLAGKHKSSIRKLLVREKKAGRLKVVERQGRKRQTFQTEVGKRKLTLDIFPPKTIRIRSLVGAKEWQVDLRPVALLYWQSGRSLTTHLEALDRANGICERCHSQAVKHVHHRVPIRRRTFTARVMSDRSQRYTAQALCEECHLEVHGGSYNRRKSNRNAGYIERCSSSVGSAVEKPITEM